MTTRHKTIYYLLFALSGFAALVYESIWAHYMKLFLGHAAYAQTLVLAIFMGGMAIGSWICGRYSGKWGNLLAGYAIAEGVIGIFALLFHPIFDNVVRFSYEVVIPQLASHTAAHTFKWVLSALLILPQSILIGMPFPLMCAAICRLTPENRGRTVALLYFANSLGAAIGVLACGFLFIRVAGLPGAIRIAGLVNIALALVVWHLARSRSRDTVPEAKPVTPARTVPLGRLGLFLLAVSLLTGTSSFIYEMGWIRMLSLVLGSSTHSFELMLSAFILGLALGAGWIRKRIDTSGDNVPLLAVMQLTMGILALATLPVYGNSFTLMQWLVKSLPQTDQGYALFNLSCHAIALAVMLPATFFAGTTLPLITSALMRRGHGEGSIGAVYAANTVGAIIGVFFAVNFGMPHLGLKGLITLGGGIDMLLGLGILWWGTGGVKRWAPAAATTLSIVVVAAVLLLVRLDPYRMASGVYRDSNLLKPDNYRLMYHRDGKTATVSLSLARNGTLSIRTNGKPDAAITMNPTREATPDEATMILSAAIPMALHPQARTAATIGLGSGLTTHTLLCNPRLRLVETIEIEEGMVEAARGFGPRVDLVYSDPRSKIHIDDARTFFSTHDRHYDIIVSEPSNPWVSGVAGLFSREFYRLVKRHLNPDGLFVQWVQLYEIDTPLVVSILKAVAENFADFEAYATNDGELLIVASNGHGIGKPDPAIFAMPDIARSLRWIQIETLQDIQLRRVGRKSMLVPLLETYPIPANSDYYPVLDQSAARTRFLKVNALELHTFTHTPLPALEMLTGTAHEPSATRITPSRYFLKSKEAFTAMALRDYFLSGRFSSDRGGIPFPVKQQALEISEVFMTPWSSADADRRITSLSSLSHIIAYLSPEELAAVWTALESKPAAARLSILERHVLNLLKAAGRRDGRAMTACAAALLGQWQEMPQSAREYIVAAGMLGALVTGDREAVFGLWEENRALLPPDEASLLFRLILANAAPS